MKIGVFAMGTGKMAGGGLLKEGDITSEGYELIRINRMRKG